MKLITLNKCLSGLDTIIYHDYKEENNNIRPISNDVRKYIIEFVEEHDKKYDKRSFIVLLQFINYLIQESFQSITFRFFRLTVGLRFLVIKFEENNLEISNNYINFDEEFLYRNIWNLRKMMMMMNNQSKEFSPNLNELKREKPNDFGHMLPTYIIT